MKHQVFFVFSLFIIFSTCKQTDKNANGALSERENFIEESAEHFISNPSGTVFISDNQNASSLFINDYGDKSIKYISWENVVRFIDYKILSLVTFDRMTEERVEYIGTYTLDIQDNITFLNVHFDNGNDERWLVLANGTLSDIYKSGSRVPGNYIHGVTGSVNRDAIIWFYPEIVRASSYLAENEISYAPDNLKIPYWTDCPWVEGTDGQGINEKLFFERGHIPNGAMYISIGYVSYEKPYLYNQNSRPKTIRLSVDNKFSLDVELKDTPHYQEIKFPSNIEVTDILTLEILEVYPGTKYEDTCINSIYFESSTGYYEIIHYWEEHPGWR